MTVCIDLFTLYICYTQICALSKHSLRPVCLNADTCRTTVCIWTKTQHGFWQDGKQNVEKERRPKYVFICKVARWITEWNVDTCSESVQGGRKLPLLFFLEEACALCVCVCVCVFTLHESQNWFNVFLLLSFGREEHKRTEVCRDHSKWSVLSINNVRMQYDSRAASF